MASWQATGAGNALYNDIYDPDGGTAGGHPTYTGRANGMRLWFLVPENEALAKWVLNNHVYPIIMPGLTLTPYYGTGASLPANPWSVMSGYEPAPTLTLYAPDALPVITNFYATPSTITVGDSSTLAWATTGAVTVTLQVGIGTPAAVAASDSEVVSPTYSVGYILRATNAAGTVTQQIALTVLPAAGAPTIDSFYASPEVIGAGDSSTLTWATTDAVTVTLQAGEEEAVAVDPDDSEEVSPTANTVYTLTATNEAGSVTQTVTVLVADATAPVVTITAPEAGEVCGLVVVEADCTDEGGLASVRLHLDGVQQGDPIAISGTAYSASFNLDLAGVVNGAHVIGVRAEDATGNVGWGTVAVTVNNLLAATPKVLFTSALSKTGHTLLEGMIALQIGDLPADPRQLYNCLVGYHTGAASADFGAYTPVLPDRSFVFPASTTQFQVGLSATPQYNLSYWEEDYCEEFFRLLDCGGRFVLIGREPATVWLLQAGALSMVADLNSLLGVTAVNDACWCDGKLYLATELGLVAYDFDALDEPLLINTRDGAQVDALATTGSALYFRQGTNLYQFSYPSPRRLSTTTPESDTPGGNLLAAGSQVLAASAVTGETNDVIYRLNGATWDAVYSANQPVRRLCQRTVGSVVQAWVGCDLGIHTSSPTWRSDGTFDSGSVYAFAAAYSYLWAGGTIGGLWRRAAAGWQQYETLEDATAIYDMTASGGVLYIACHATGDVARLYALQISEGGSFACGPNPPDLNAQILKSLAG